MFGVYARRPKDFVLTLSRLAYTHTEGGSAKISPRRSSVPPQSSQRQRHTERVLETDRQTRQTDRYTETDTCQSSVNNRALESAAQLRGSAIATCRAANIKQPPQLTCLIYQSRY